MGGLRQTVFLSVGGGVTLDPQGCEHGGQGVVGIFARPIGTSEKPRNNGARASRLAAKKN